MVGIQSLVVLQIRERGFEKGRGRQCITTIFVCIPYLSLLFTLSTLFSFTLHLANWSFEFFSLSRSFFDQGPLSITYLPKSYISIFCTLPILHLAAARL